MIHWIKIEERDEIGDGHEREKEGSNNDKDEEDKGWAGAKAWGQVDEEKEDNLHHDEKKEEEDADRCKTVSCPRPQVTLMKVSALYGGRGK